VLGDDFNDFVSAPRLSSAERRAIAEREKARWGRDWIIIPNPMYGSWESAATNFQFRATPDERRRIKNDVLQGFE
jgi:acid phosphatase